MPASRTRGFLSKTVCFSFVCPSTTPQSTHQPMRYFFGGPFPVGTDVFSFLNLFVHLIANAHIQDITRAKKKKTQRNHPEVVLSSTKISLPSKKQNRGNLSFYFVRTRKMLVPKPYENHRRAQFSFDIFYWGINLWNSGSP